MLLIGSARSTSRRRLSATNDNPTLNNCWLPPPRRMSTMSRAPTESHPTATEQSIVKSATGIEGFDELTGGGLPARRTTLLLGGPGAGKTVFALETLVNGARDFREPGIFVAFEENSRAILANAATFGWNLPALER